MNNDDLMTIRQMKKILVEHFPYEVKMERRSDEIFLYFEENGFIEQNDFLLLGKTIRFREVSIATYVKLRWSDESHS